MAQGIASMAAKMDKKKASVIASVLVVCIAVPIAVASAVDNGKNETPPTLISEAGEVEISTEPSQAASQATISSSAKEKDVAQGLKAEEPKASEKAKQEPTPSPAPTTAPKAAKSAEPKAAKSAEPKASVTPEPKVTAFAKMQASVEPIQIGFQLKYGDDSEKVAKVQERLMALGYMEEDEPTEHFGSATRQSVKLFQRKHELDIDGIVDQDLWDLLFSNNAKKYSVSVGTTGTDVEELQKRLRELGYIDAVTGYYGTDTEAAVKRFQERNGLTVDGNIGEQTKEMLYSENAKANALDYGTESEEVKKYQKRLINLGYLTEEATGLYGKNTVAAVKKFQEKNGLIADGTLGPATKEALDSKDAQINALLIGDSGSEVEKAQQRLIELNYLKGSTGYFGSDTERAVIRFQEKNNLKADGKIGPATLKTLYSNDAAKWTSSDGDEKPAPSSDKKPTASDKKDDKTTADAQKPSSEKEKDDEAEKPQVSGANASSLVSVAKSKLGSKYVLGAKGPSKFDCSGFVYWCLNQIGVKQGYMTSAGWKNSSKYPTVKSLSQVQKGDIIVFKGHVGIALGGGQMIDASSSKGQIRITNLNQPYWQRNFIKACRVL